MKQLVGLLRQMRYVESVDAVSANHHFVVRFASNFENLQSDIDIVTVPTIYKVVFDIVLYMNTK